MEAAKKLNDSPATAPATKEEQTAAPPPPPPEAEHEAYVVTRTFSIPAGHQLHTFQRGTVIDDPHVIGLLRRAFAAGRPPLRKATQQDFMDGDW